MTLVAELMTRSSPLAAARTSAQPLEVRAGIARFDGGAELVMRQVEIRAGTAVETTAPDGTVSRLVDVVWTTGAGVTRYSWADDEYYDEVLEVSDTAIRMDRLRNGASVLDSHWGYGLESVLGVVDAASIANGVGVATLRMANTPDLDVIWAKVKDGIIRHISVGYQVYAWTVTRQQGVRTVKVATDWEPFEISFVAVPADQGCTVRAEVTPALPIDPINDSEEEDEEVKRNVVLNAGPAAETVAAAGATETRAAPAGAAPAVTNAQAVIAAERSRNADISRYCRTHGVTEADRDAAIEAGTSFADFVRTNVDAVATRSEATAVNAVRAEVVNERSPERELELRSQAFGFVEMQRAGLRAPEISAEARSFANDGFRGIAILALRTAGVAFNPNAPDADLIGRAFEVSARGMLGTSGLGDALGNPLHMALDQSYESQIAETNYQDWAGSTTVRDFKVNKAIHVGFLTGIRDVVEGGELPLAKLGSGARYFKLGTRGLKVGFTRQALINDEFGVLLQAVAKLGIVYRHDEQGIAVAALLAGIMTTDSGNEAIFGADYGNLLHIAALDVDGLSDVSLALRTQKFGAEIGLTNISVTPKRILVSPDLETKALRLVTPIMSVTADGVNPFANRNLSIDVINELPEGTGFLTGQTGLSDVIEYARLASAQGPQVQATPATSYMGQEWETWNDFTAYGKGRTGIVKFTVG